MNNTDIGTNVPKLRFTQNGRTSYPDWGEYTIEEMLLEYRLGGNYPNSETRTEAPLIKMGNLGRGYIDLGKMYFIEDGVEIDEEDRIKQSDLFFNTRNTLDLVGKVAIWRGELERAFYNSNLMRLTFKNNYFMNYLFNSFDGIKKLRRLATGTTSVAAIYTRDLIKVKFFVPEEKEQQKIAVFLGAVDAKLDALRRKRELLAEYKRGVMQKLFEQEIRFTQDDGRPFPDWEIVEFGQIANRVSKKFDPTKSTVEHLLIELENLDSGNGKIINLQSTKDQRSIKTCFSSGDVLFGKLRPYLKKFAFVEFSGVCSSEIWVLRSKNFNKKYLYYLIQTERFFRSANVSSGSKMPRADWDIVSSTTFRIPFAKEQQKIADFLTAIDNKITAVDQQIGKIETFKKGLLQQMFV